MVIPLKESYESSQLKNILIGINNGNTVFYGIPNKHDDSILHSLLENSLNQNTNPDIQASTPGNCPPFYIEYYGLDSPCFPCCVHIDNYFNYYSPAPISSDNQVGGGSSSGSNDIELGYYFPNSPCPFNMPESKSRMYKY